MKVVVKRHVVFHVLITWDHVNTCSKGINVDIQEEVRTGFTYLVGPGLLAFLPAVSLSA